MAHHTPIVAFLYDFDKTLCTTDMQNYAFIPSLHMTPTECWAVANGCGRANRMDGILAYMYTMSSLYILLCPLMNLAFYS